MKKVLLSLFFLHLSCMAHATEISESLPSKEQVDEKMSSELSQGLPSADYKKTFIKMMVSLGLLLLLLVTTLWAFKRMVRHRQKQANEEMLIKIIEKRVLSPKSMLYLIEIENRKILLSESTLEVRSHKILDDNLWQEKN